MRVDEAGAQQPAGEVDDLDLRAPVVELVETRVRDGHDHAFLDQHLAGTPVAVAVEQRTPREQGAAHRPSSSGPAGSWVRPRRRAAMPESASRQTRLAR